MKKYPLVESNLQGGLSQQGKVLDYDFLNKLGEGSYGTVFKVIRKSDKRMCVIKQINMAKLSSRARNDAKNEVTILSQMDNEYIVKYFDSFLESNTLYIVMEYCEGGDLASYLKNQAGRPLSENKIWKFFIQMCLGLEYLHKLKVLHRDIKTLNIFLNKEESVRIGDLGVAKVLCDASDFARTMVGTPYYLSPEMCEEKPYNEKSDVWALGCVLYEICTNRHPFEGNNQGSLMAKIIKGKFNPLPELYSRELREIVAVCLNRNYIKRLNISEILDTEVVRKKAEQLAIDINRVGTGTPLPLKTQTIKKSKTEKLEKKGLESPTKKVSDNPKINKEEQLKKLLVKNEKNQRLKQEQVTPVQLKPADNPGKEGLISVSKDYLVYLRKEPVADKKIEDLKKLENQRNAEQQQQIQQIQPPVQKITSDIARREANQGVFSKIRQQGFSGGASEISKPSPSPFIQRKGSEIKATPSASGVSKKENPPASKKIMEEKRESIFRPPPSNNQNIFKNIASEELRNPFGKKASADVAKDELKNLKIKEDPPKVSAREEKNKLNQAHKEPFMRDFKSVHRIRKGAPLEMAWQAVMVGRVSKQASSGCMAEINKFDTGGEGKLPAKKAIQNKVTTYKNQAEYMSDLKEVENLPDIKKEKQKGELCQEELAYMEKNEWKNDFFNERPHFTERNQGKKAFPIAENDQSLNEEKGKLSGIEDEGLKSFSKKTLNNLQSHSLRELSLSSEDDKGLGKEEFSSSTLKNIEPGITAEYEKRWFSADNNQDASQLMDKTRQEEENEAYNEDSTNMQIDYNFNEEGEILEEVDQGYEEEPEEEEVFVSDDDLEANAENMLTKDEIGEKLEVYEAREAELDELIDKKVSACVSEIGNEAFDYIITFFKSKLNSDSELNESDQMEIDKMIEERLEDQNNPNIIYEIYKILHLEIQIEKCLDKKKDLLNLKEKLT